MEKVNGSTPLCSTIFSFGSHNMDIPWQTLRPETLRAVIEEFISRDGTDYGLREASFDSKVETVYRLLRDKKARVVFDTDTQSCDIREITGTRR